MNKFVSTSMESITMRAAMTSMLMPACATGRDPRRKSGLPCEGPGFRRDFQEHQASGTTKGTAGEHAGGRGADLGPTPQATIEMVGRAREVPSSAVATRGSIARGRGSTRPYATKHNPACGPNASAFARTQLATASAVEMQLFHSFDEERSSRGPCPPRRSRASLLERTGRVYS